MRLGIGLTIATALWANAAAASEPPAPLAPAGAPAPMGPDIRRIPAPGGEVILVGPRDEMAWSELKFAPVRRAGDTVYLSGVVVGPRPGEAHDTAAFKAQARRAFGYIEAALKAAGVSFADVARIETFHVWDSPNFEGGKAEQFEAFAQVKDEYFKPPYPAWTAVGVTELLPSAGIVEIQLTAHVPPKPAPPPAKPKPKPRPKPKPKPAPPPANADAPADSSRH